MTNHAFYQSASKGGGELHRVRERAPRRRPSYNRDMAVLSLLFAAFAGGFTLGLSMAVHRAGQGEPEAAINYFALAVGGLVGFVALYLILPHYWNLQMPLRVDEAETLNGQDGKARWIEPPGDGPRRVSGDYWRVNWQRTLANLLLDDSGEWRGVSTMNRDNIMAKLIYDAPRNYNDAVAALVDAGWLDNETDKKFTDKCYRELKEAQFIPTR